MVKMPPQLNDAIRKLVGGQGGFAAKHERMSQHYRGGGRSDAAVDLYAYLLTRMPATFAAVTKCLAHLPATFAPKSLLDAGSGPGTASWAAAMAYPSLLSVTFLDNNAKFLDLAKNLARHSSNPALTMAAPVAGDLQNPHAGLNADLVIAAYALAELPQAIAGTSALALWRACNEILVLIEPGTPQGFARIVEARKALIAAGANVLAPCTHANVCPVATPDWCHFSVRLPRRREHLHAKNAQVPFEDEKFSFVIASRSPSQTTQSRILAPPVKTKPEITFKLCSGQGLTAQSVATRDKVEYKRIRKLGWGDLL
jgi:ribosomal protein RSM22 (predicted rRNA methylase)